MNECEKPGTWPGFLVQKRSVITFYPTGDRMNLGWRTVESDPRDMTATPSPAIAYEYVWFNGQPAAQFEIATGAIHWYFNDHLGMPLLTTSASAAVDWRVEREPYGRIAAHRTGLDRHQPLGFPGQEHDPGTDLMYNIFRWYRAAWGRYTQAVPYTGVVGGGGFL